MPWSLPHRTAGEREGLWPAVQGLHAPHALPSPLSQVSLMYIQVLVSKINHNLRRPAWFHRDHIQKKEGKGQA